MVHTVSPLYKPEQSICSLPVFEPVRERVTRAFESRPDVKRLAAIVMLDPALTAELLAAANAPAYGHALQVYTAADAIKVLGWSETERLANLAFEAQAKFQTEIIQSFIRTDWAHSLACAVAASCLAEFFEMPEDRAFAFCLLHDIGAWGLIGQSPDAYRQLFVQGSRTSVEKLGAEECLMGINHCRAGSWLVSSWGLPTEFGEATAMHYGAPVKGFPQVAGIVSVACRWADALGFRSGHAEKVSVRDAIRHAPARIMPALKTAEAEIGRKCRAKLSEYAREFDLETARLLVK